MPTYDPLLSLTEMTPGDPNIKNSWGTVLDQQFTLLGQAITGDNGYGGGVGGISVAGLSTYALTATAGASNQARQLVYPFVGALSGPCMVTIPASVKIGWAINATTGGQNVILTSGSGTQLTLLPNKFWYFFYCDGQGNITSPSIAISAGLITGAALTPSSLTTGALTVTGTSTFDGTVTAANVNVAGAASFGGTLGVVGASSLAAATLSGNLTVNGTSTLVGAVTMDAGLTTNGTTIFNNTTTMTGSLSVPQGLQVGGLAVTGTAGITCYSLQGGQINCGQIISGGSAQFSGGLTVGSLTVAGSAVLDGMYIGEVSTSYPIVQNGIVITSSTYYGYHGYTYSGPYTELVAGVAGGIVQGTGNPQTGYLVIGILNVGQSIITNSVVATSDARVKTERTRISDADGERFVREVPGMLYLKEDKTGNRSWESGFLAQDVLAAGFTEMVFGFDDETMPASRYGADGPDGVRLEMVLGGQVAYLSAALRSALDKIDALTALLDTLEAD